MHHEFVIDGKSVELTLERRGPGEFVARFGDESWEVAADRVDAHTVAVRVGERVVLGTAAENEGVIHVATAGRHFTLIEAAGDESATHGPADASGGRILSSPMPGTVVRVLVREGDRVERGQLCAVVEAMKMENELRAGKPGTVVAVRVVEKRQVAGGETLVEIDPADE